jgi:hypothetical protein
MPVVGDPAGMRAAAAQLRWKAERLTALAAQVDQAVVSMTFAGPAADRWRPGVADQSARLRSSALRLDAAADVLNRDAALVEEQERLELLRGGQP